MRIAMFPNPSGSAIWRLIDPAKYMRRYGFDVKIAEGGINDEIAQWADVYVLQSCVYKEGIALLYAYQQEYGKKIVSDWDDYVIADDSNPNKKLHKIKQYAEVSDVVLKMSNLVTVTTQYLKERYDKYNSNVVVLGNSMDMRRWDRPKKKNETDTIRIGWAGSFTHLKDLEMVSGPLKRILRDFKNVQLVLVGEPRAAEMFKGYNTEVMLGVPIDYWPDKLNGLQLDIGIAPLVDNEFNRCKSNIKWQEYSIAKVPGVFSSTVYGSTATHIIFDGNIGMLADTEEEWYGCLKNYIICKNLRDDIAAHAYSVVKQEYDLKRNIKGWVEAYRKLTQ